MFTKEELAEIHARYYFKESIIGIFTMVAMNDFSNWELAQANSIKWYIESEMQ